jgi:hypothetical protein
LSVLDDEGIPLHVYIGDFATLGYTGELKGGGDEVIPTPPVIPHNPEEPEGTENVNVKDEKTKVWMDGRLILFIDGKTFDFTGKRIE